MQVKSIAECSKGEHSAILSTFIKLPFVIKIIALSTFELPFYTGFTVQKLWPMLKCFYPHTSMQPKNNVHPVFQNRGIKRIILTRAMYFPDNVSDYTYSMLAAIIK